MAGLGYNKSSRPAGHQTHPIFPEISAATASKTSWTSARCHRLLRPLSSRLALLRKERQLENCQSQQSLGISPTKFGETSGSEGALVSLGKTRLYSRPLCAKDEEEEWESNSRPSKRIKRTYSSRAKTVFPKEDNDEQTDSDSNRRANSAVIELPPQLSLEAGQHETTPPNEATNHRLSHNQRDPYRIYGLSKELVQNDLKLVDGICKALAALLKATHIWKPPHTTGCLSLLSMCLRQVPQHITEEEALSKTDDPDSDVDISTMIYSDLEDFGTMPGGGWEPLRLLVRAHGLKLITDAIYEGLLGLPVARYMYYLCLDVFACDEAQCIIESLVNRAKHAQDLLRIPATPLPDEVHMVVTSLDSLASRYGRKAFRNRQSAAILESDVLSASWISSKLMIGTWNGVIQSLTQGDQEAQSAALLLRAAVAVSYRSTTARSQQDVHGLRLRIDKACHRPMLRSSINISATESMTNREPITMTTNESLNTAPDGAINSTLQSVFTVMTAVARLQAPSSNQDSDGLSTLTTNMLQELALEASQAAELLSQSNGIQQSRESYADSLHLPLLAAGLAELASSRSHHDIPQQDSPSLSKLAELSTSKEVFRGAGSFLCSVARCCGRARSDDPFNVIKALVDDLTVVSKSTCSDISIRKLCNNLALRAAFTYSEDTSRPTHLDWALRVERDLTGKDNGTPKAVSVRTPVHSHVRTKDCFRWEEGICEWIVKTPALSMQKPTQMKPEIDHVDETSLLLYDGIPQTLPMISENPPATKNKNIVKKQSQRETGERKALHVLIQVEPDISSNGGAVKELRPRNNQPCKLRLSPGIHEDDDIDELSTTVSSQEGSSALSALREPPNAAIGTKRKRQSGRQHRTKRLSTSSSVTSKLHVEIDSQDLEIEDVDELATLSTW